MRGGALLPELQTGDPAADAQLTPLDAKRVSKPVNAGVSSEQHEKRRNSSGNHKKKQRPVKREREEEKKDQDELPSDGKHDVSVKK